MDRSGPRSQTLRQGAVLSLDQIRALRGSNEYSSGPAVAPKPSEKPERTHEIIRINLSNNLEHPPALSRSTSTGSAASSGSNSSGGSDRGLLVRSPRKHRAERSIRTQPKSLGLAPFLPPFKVDLTHSYICESCGKCKCGECTAPCKLPARLACNGQCLLSAENLVEHVTCMCLVKGIFYHCSDDDDDVSDASADQPCSLSHPQCCSRFLCMGLMSALLPCLLCYLPAKACVHMCNTCHDRIQRPGCRCKNSNAVLRKLQSWEQTLGRPKPS